MRVSKQTDQAWMSAAAGGMPGLAPDCLESFPNPAAILDPEGRIVIANDGFSAEAGLSSEDGGHAAEALLEALTGQPGRTVSLPGREGQRLVDLQVLPLAEPGWRLVMAIDRTVDVHMRSALAVSRRRFKELVEISSDHAWETVADGSFSMMSARGLAGRAGPDLVGVQPSSLFADSLPAPALSPFSTPVPVEEVEVWMADSEGKPLCFEVSAVPLFDTEGRWSGARGICRDVTRDRRNRAHLAEHRDQERILARITGVFRAEANPDDMLRLAASASTHGFSAHGCQILTTPPSAKADTLALTLTPAAAFGKLDEKLPLDPVLDQVTAEDAPDVQVVPYDGWSVLTARIIYAARPVGAILLWRGPTRPAWSDTEKSLLRSVAGQLGAAIELRGNYHALVDISRSDPLTGVLNRRGFYDEVKRRFARMQRTPSNATLLYCDLDNFKLVNDVHGHGKGDEALRHVADILRNNSRSTDLVARLGGDEFAVWLDNAGEQAAIGRAQVFLTAAKSLRMYSGSHNRPLTLSIGMAVYESASRESINDFLSRADAAMYSVKKDGKGHYAVAPGVGR
jgi:diguanylate cyclase (GGDEF)-like protein